MSDVAEKTTTIYVRTCTPVYHSTTKKGDPYTVYEVGASKVVNGEPEEALIPHKLRSFAPYIVNQAVEVTVTPYHSQEYGDSFTLAPKRGHRSAGSTQAINEFREEIVALREIVQGLAERVGALEKRQPAAAQPPPSQPDQAALSAHFGDEVPY